MVTNALVAETETACYECAQSKNSPNTEYGLPDGWKYKPLFSVLSVSSGQVDPRQEPYRSMVLVAPDHVEGATGRLLQKRTAGDQKAISGKYEFAPGDIVYSKIRPYLRKAILADFSGLCSADMYPLRPLPGAVPGYLFAVILGEHFSKYAESVSVRSGMPKINRAELSDYTILIPTSEVEQQAVADALSDADALIESLEQLIVKKRAVKQGATEELLSGRRRLPGFASKWKRKKLGDIGDALIGLTYSPRDVRKSGTLVLRSSNVQGGKIAFENNVFVDMEIPDRARVQEHDILICVRNGSRELIGKSAKIDHRCQGMAFGAFMAVFRTPHHDFVFHQLQSNEFRRQVNEHLGATINQITNKSLNSFEIPFPTDECERTEIARLLNEMGAELEALDMRLRSARQIKQGMMQELLTGRVRLV